MWMKCRKANHRDTIPWATLSSACSGNALKYEMDEGRWWENIDTYVSKSTLYNEEFHLSSIEHSKNIENVIDEIEEDQIVG